MSCLQHNSVQTFQELPNASFSMIRITNILLILIVIRTTSFVTGGALQPQHHHGSGCVPAERAALLSFKKGITNDSTNLLGSWRGQDCCRWRGIECSNQTGHVIKLQLRNPNPDMDDWDLHYVNGLYGEISPSLLSLKHLEYMDLSMNNLLGPSGRIPHFLGSYENLRYLNISGMPFTGRVPSQLGNLSKLQYLDLCMLFGSDTYSADITWLTRLPLLQYLRMDWVNLTGTVAWPRILNMIPSLRVISLRGCLLDTASQLLPHFNLTRLEKLDLSFNNLEETVASTGWFWKATSLKYLSLNTNKLVGQFPDALGNMTSLQVLDLSFNYSNLTMNIKNLCSLEILDLSDNDINGNVMDLLPKCKINKLQELHLSDNSFTGTLQNFIPQFTSLRILDLSHNQLVGPIPLGLGNFKCLTIIDLTANQLIGPIPPVLGNLKCLTILDLTANQLIGPIPPVLGNLKCLTTLHLDSNHLKGSVPTEISSLSNLIDLNLAWNNLSGVITEEHLAGLKSLKYLDLSFNNLKVMLDSDWLPPFRLQDARFASCHMGPRFPAWLQRLETTGLDISSTGLKDEAPDWFWSTLSQAKFLNISNNQITGSLPSNLDGMAFEKLRLGSNQFTGPIPSLPASISVLDISNNSFSGTLPSNLGSLNLEILIMHSNRIDGYIPESLCKSRLLGYLDLSNNNLEGEIPQCLDLWIVRFLLLSKNSLSGKFPALLQNSTNNLELLDLSWNKFSGRLPTWIGELGKLRFLLLGHNTFSDSIPVEIINLEYLQYLDLSYNNFSGAIPWPLSKLTSMEILQNKFMLGTHPIWMDLLQEDYDGEVDYLGEIFSVVTKGQQLIYGRTLAYFVSIDLSGNSLTGEIPTDITSLVSLMNLNLSSNQLSGQIPRMIGAMQSLASLDLSRNKLSGEIPLSLSSLSSLSYLNLSYNNLSGRIPSGRQLDTLDVYNQSLMYIGNSGLCGPPLQKNCSGNNTIINGHLSGSKQEFEVLTFYFGLVLGLVAGHWMVFCTLLFKKTWSIAYFQFFDKLYDRIYVFVVVNWGSSAKNRTTD